MNISAVEQWGLSETVECRWKDMDFQRLAGMADCFMRGAVREELLFLVRIAKIKWRESNDHQA